MIAKPSKRRDYFRHYNETRRKKASVEPKAPKVDTRPKLKPRRIDWCDISAGRSNS